MFAFVAAGLYVLSVARLSFAQPIMEHVFERAGARNGNVTIAANVVLVALGAFQSPQLLLVSEIGPSSELAEYNIEPVLINENVGRE